MGKLTNKLANEILVKKGYFHGLDYILNEYGLSQEKERAVRRELYKYLNFKVQEAKKELVHIQTALTQMEAVCRRGEQSNATDNIYTESEGLRRACLNLEGWTISLLESLVTLEAAVLTPETAGNTVNKLKHSFAELWAIRIDDGFKMMSRHPEVFGDFGMEYFPNGSQGKHW